MEKRRMCPNCRAFVSISDRVCPYCNMQLGPRAVDTRPSQFAASFMPRANITSIVILSLNCLIFLIEIIFNIKYADGGGFNISGGVQHLLGAKYGPDIYLNHQWWRLITAGFLHGGLLHIGFNSYALFILVTETEQFYGTARLIVAYIVATLLGFATSTYFSPMTLSTGASAAAFGLIGAMLALGIRRRNDPLVQLVRRQYTQWLIFSLVLTVFSRGIDIWAHAGGFAGGFLMGLIGGLPGLPGSPREALWKTLAGVAIFITAVAFLLDFVSARLLLQRS